MATKNPGQLLRIAEQAGQKSKAALSASYFIPTVTLLLVVLDFAIATGSFILAYWLREGLPVFIRYEEGGWPVWFTKGFLPYLSVLIFVPFIRVAAMRHYDLYRLRGEFSILQDIVGVFLATSVGSLIIIMITFLYRGGYTFRDFSYSRLVFIIDWAIALLSFIALRLIVRSVQIAYRQRAHNLIPTLIVGSGELAQVCIGEIAEKPRLGYSLVGIVTASGNNGDTVDGVPILGNFNCLPAIIRQYGIQEVLITDTSISNQQLFETIMRCGRSHRVDFRVVPNLFNCLPRKTEIDQIGSLPMIKLFEEPLQGPNRFIKRSVDLLASFLLLLFTWPLWLLLIILIKLDSKGPIFYKQERVGMDGHIFLMYKFRSMYADADDSKHREVMRQTIKNKEAANQGSKDRPLYGKVKDDPRITRVGAWMRKYSLDELPQILNVIKGEMSLVGPRPPIPYEVEEYMDWHRARFHIIPGITGLWQVSGRNRLTFDEMIRLDIYYIENWSLWLDFKILLKTPAVVLRGDNEC